MSGLRFRLCDARQICASVLYASVSSSKKRIIKELPSESCSAQSSWCICPLHIHIKYQLLLVVVILGRKSVLIQEKQHCGLHLPCHVPSLFA